MSIESLAVRLRELREKMIEADAAYRNGLQIIQKSLGRVAKKKFAGKEGEMEGYTREVMGNITTMTDA